ncbi:MAG TPA: TonB-dependent receptor [Rhizomicrobium sp.]|nr:TonB-dependent receptor [Rhizomicrobium sp.]
MKVLAHHLVASACCIAGVFLATGPAAAQETGDQNSIEHVTVTGTRLTERGAQDVRIYDQTSIQNSGQSTVADFLATVPEVSLNSPDNTLLATTVRLRGAPFGSTLVLINGQRTGSTGGAAPFGMFDLSTVPLALIDRIEVLPTGSSAIYGGDALAGVVNIVLRSDFTGFEVDAGYKGAGHTDEKHFAFAAGGKWDALSVSLMGTYQDQSPLFGFQRSITANPDYRRFGGPNLGTAVYGTPATIFSVSGNLPGLNASYAAVPAESTGVGLTPANFAATAGTQNTGFYSTYQSLVLAVHRIGLFLDATYRLGSSTELFGELLATQYNMLWVTTPPSLQLVNVPASNAFNPFGVAVSVSGLVQGAQTLATYNYGEKLLRPLIGARGNINSWHWEITAINSHDINTPILRGQVNSGLLSTALASSDPSSALNPFTAGPMGSQSLLASIYSVSTTSQGDGLATTVNGFARGPLLDLPGGALEAVLGGEYQYSSLDYGFHASRDAKSVFGELRAPLLGGGGDNGPLVALDGAIRYDNYSDFGSKVTWQAGAELRPDDGILVRGTFAAAFKPPTLYNLYSPVSGFSVSVSDPKLNNQTEVVQESFGGNSHLNPTTGTSGTLGVVWSPRFVPGLQLSFTNWWLHIANAINFPSDQFIVSNESSYPGRVVRAAAPAGGVGLITSVDVTYLNFGAMDEQGVDMNADYRFETSVGTFTPSLAATYMTEFDGASSPGLPIVSRLSRANNDGIFAPRWKGIVSVGWTPDAILTTWLAGRYIGRYVDYTPPRNIGGIWYLDASLSVDLNRALDIEGPAHMKFLLSATNIADTLPVYSTFFRGYDVFNYDLIGRTLFARVQVDL